MIPLVTKHGLLCWDSLQFYRNICSVSTHLCKVTFPRVSDKSDSSSSARPRAVPSIDSYINILQGCKEKRDLSHCKSLLLHLCNHGIDSHYAVGNDVVRTFVESGSVSDAQKVFNKLAFRNVHSWTSLIWSYVQTGQPKAGLNLYKLMHEDVVPPSTYTFVAVLKACIGLKDMEEGHLIHCDIVQMGFENDTFVGTTLVDMYAKFSSFLEASECLMALSDRDVVSWSALIEGYAEQGLMQQAMRLYESMQHEDVSPSPVTFLALLRGCSGIESLLIGQDIHNEALVRGFEEDPLLANTFVCMYAKCDSLPEAKSVFLMLPIQDYVAWNAVLAGYADHGLSREALDWFELMQKEEIIPTPASFVCALKACADLGVTSEGQRIHKHITQEGQECQMFVGNALVDMYSRCGLPLEARNVFNGLPSRDTVSWNALITGYIESKLFEEALTCDKRMGEEDVFRDVVTFLCTLKACGCMQDLSKGLAMHTEVIERAFEEDVLISSSLVDMYSKCGALEEAQQCLDVISSPNIVSWNSLIAGHAEYGHTHHKAMDCYEQLQRKGVLPSTYTFNCLLKACGGVRARYQVQALHMAIVKLGSEGDVTLCSSIVEGYMKCESIVEARTVFDNLQGCHAMSWNVIIAGYVDNGMSQAALTCWNEMLAQGISPDAITLASIAKACGYLGLKELGQEVHNQIMCKGFEGDPFINSILIDTYTRCHLLSDAKDTLQMTTAQNVVSWNAAIAGFMEHGSAEEALQCFQEMQAGDLLGDMVTYVGAIKASLALTAIEEGREIHREVCIKGLEKELEVGSTLVCMYAECGLISEARNVFNQLEARNLVVWNAMIKSYGINHEGEMAIKLFREMLEERLDPDVVTFTCVLTTCSRASLVGIGEQFFKVMQQRYGFSPTNHHYSCIADLLGRAGHVSEAEKFLGAIPQSMAKNAWRSLLMACKIFEEAELGSKCFWELVQ